MIAYINRLNRAILISHLICIMMILVNITLYIYRDIFFSDDIFPFFSWVFFVIVLVVIDLLAWDYICNIQVSAVNTIPESIRIELVKFRFSSTYGVDQNFNSMSLRTLAAVMSDYEVKNKSVSDL